MRERGLKSGGLCKVPKRHFVALLARAWIEMSGTGPKDWSLNLSLSLRERGLKSVARRTQVAVTIVALLARAWIEIYKCLHKIGARLVALLARAWIEIR